MFGEPTTDGAPPRIDRLWIEDGELVFLHPAEETRNDVGMESREASREGVAPPVLVEGSGTWRGNDFNLGGRAPSLLNCSSPTPAPATVSTSGPAPDARAPMP